MNIVIIGNGISGTTLARHIRKKSNHDVTVISNETDYLFSRTALMYIYMGHMKFEHTQPYEPWFWKKNRINLIKKYVKKIDTQNKTLHFSNNKDTLKYDKLILACGSKPNKFGWKGQDLKGVGGMYSYQDLMYLEDHSPQTKHAVIVGGGLIGVELAEMFHSRSIGVSFLVREKSFWNGVLPPGESQIVNQEIVRHGIDLRLGTELKEILPDENGRAKAVITGTGEEIPCQFVGLTAGVSPNIDFLKDSPIETQRGIIINHTFETNIPDIYAIGDCAQFRDPLPKRRPLEQVWYTGRMHGETLAHTLTGNKKMYNPSHWFNSAKFFDIEYQTYGTVLAQNPQDQKSFYWEHQNSKKCMHFVFEKESLKFIGVNTFGIRLRHETFDQWLNDNRTINYVLSHLKDANFDPEFYTKYEESIISQFNQENKTKIKSQKVNWKKILNRV